MWDYQQRQKDPSKASHHTDGADGCSSSSFLKQLEKIRYDIFGCEDAAQQVLMSSVCPL